MFYINESQNTLRRNSQHHTTSSERHKSDRTQESNHESKCESIESTSPVLRLNLLSLQVKSQIDRKGWACRMSDSQIQFNWYEHLHRVFLIIVVCTCLRTCKHIHTHTGTHICTQKVTLIKYIQNCAHWRPYNRLPEVGLSKMQWISKCRNSIWKILIALKLTKW
jgi:hypothetical protein